MQSVLPKKRNLYKAHVNDPMLQQVDGRLTFVRNAFEEEEALEVVCCVCKKRFNVLKIDVRHCDYYWCSQDCFSKLPWESPRIRVFKKKAELQAEKVCPKCGGPARGRGFEHADDCPEMITKTEKRICPECGGPAKGRGFSHKEDCNLKTQPYVPVKERGGSDV